MVLIEEDGGDQNRKASTTCGKISQKANLQGDLRGYCSKSRGCIPNYRAGKNTGKEAVKLNYLIYQR